MGFFPERMYEGMNWRRRHGEPKNRRQLFQCVFTDQFFSLIPVNLLYLVFWRCFLDAYAAIQTW